MCDINQFFVTVHINGYTSVVIAKYYMQDVLMKFGLCYLVVIDDSNPFKGVSIAMYDYLTINYEVVSRCNYKGVSIE